MPALPLNEHASTWTRPQDRVPKGLDAAALRLAETIRRHRFRFRDLEAEAGHIHEQTGALRRVTQARLDEQLAARHRLARRRAARGLTAEERVAAFALLGETIRRETGLSPYPEQFLGALVMSRGALAEMATGEGKTLTIGLTAAYLAWRGRPCHVVTANDYLVERDATWLGGFYQRCGLRAGTVIGESKPEARRAAYAADITYVTSKEVVADFLRDRLALRHLAHPDRRLIRQLLRPGRDPAPGTVMRGLHAAIIDEADHVLIDEAVTPLIISRPVDNVPLAEACREANRLADHFSAGVHYERIPRHRDIEWKPAGEAALDGIRAGLPSIWRSHARSAELLRQALIAREFFLRGEQYVITPENKIAIIDESTGRLMPERTWRQGLHQAIEAKEGLPVTLPSESLSRLSFQRYFRLYGKLCGCTGTAREAAREFWHIYRLPVFPIRTHRPCIREPLPPRLFATARAKREAIAGTVAAAHLGGQPVLLGTRTVTESETLSALLRDRGLPHQLLNATRHREEAAIVAQAGHRGAITIATNMAGRGTDIRLGLDVPHLGGLLVIGSEPHGSARIDRQLEGRCARQGEPGRVQLFASLEDEVAVRFLPRWLRGAVGVALERNVPGAPAFTLVLLRFAQGRSGALAYRQRKAVPRQDEWLSESLAFAGPEEAP